MLCTQLAGCDIGQQAGMGWEMNVWPCFAPRPRRRERDAIMRPRVRLGPGGRRIRQVKSMIS